MQMCFLCRMTTSKPPRRTCAPMKVSGKNNQYFIIWLKNACFFCAVDKFWRFVCLISLQVAEAICKDFNYLNAQLCWKGNKSYKLSQSRASGAKCCCLHFQLQRETIKPCSASPCVSFQFFFSLLIAAVVWGQPVWGERRAQVSRRSLLRRAGTKVANQEMRERAVSRIH